MQFHTTKDCGGWNVLLINTSIYSCTMHAVLFLLLLLRHFGLHNRRRPRRCRCHTNTNTTATDSAKQCFQCGVVQMRAHSCYYNMLITTWCTSDRVSAKCMVCMFGWCSYTRILVHSLDKARDMIIQGSAVITGTDVSSQCWCCLFGAIVRPSSLPWQACSSTWTVAKLAATITLLLKFISKGASVFLLQITQPRARVCLLLFARNVCEHAVGVC